MNREQDNEKKELEGTQKSRRLAEPFGFSFNLQSKTGYELSEPIGEKIEVINEEKEQIEFTKILNILEEDKRFALFHTGISNYKTIIKELQNQEYFGTTPCDAEETNFIVLENNKKIYPTKEGWVWLLKRRLFTKEELENPEKSEILRESNNHLFDRIHKAEEECLKSLSDDIEEEKLIKELMSDENFTKFLYDFISHAILASKNVNHLIGISKFCVDLGDKICKYLIIMKKPKLYNMLYKLEEQGIDAFQNQEELVEIIKIMTMVFNAKKITDKSIQPLFKEMKLEGKKIQEVLFYYFKQKLYIVNVYVIKHRNKLPPVGILGQPVLESIYSMEKYNEISYLKVKNQYKQCIASIGDIFSENVLIRNNIFIRHKDEKGGPSKRLSKSSAMTNTDMWTFRPETTMLKQILISYKPDIPILDTKHIENLIDMQGEIKYKLLYQKEDQLIHNNENISLRIKDKSYLSSYDSDKMQVKYTIDIDYLKEFLLLLIKTKTKGNHYSIYDPYINPDQIMFIRSYIEMHNINLDIIDQLINKYAAKIKHNVEPGSLDAIYMQNRKIYFQLLGIIGYLCDEIMQVETYKTKAQILKELQTADLMVYIHSSIPPINWKEIPHKSLIEEFIDKLCHRKLFIVRLINDCIEHAIYDHFSVNHFVDSRGRAYGRIIYMNVNTNHPAKLFVKLYDINKGAPFNETIKRRISDILLFENPKKSLAALDPKNVHKQNEKLVEQYILSLCDKSCVITDVEHLLNNPNYNHMGSMTLLRDIKPKKEKERLFIHSLIRSERMIRYSKKISQPQRFINYAEKDARSSGLQMISILFRSKSLAKWANLVKGETMDIYSIITKACKERKEELLFITQTALKIFDCDNFFSELRSLAPIKLEKIKTIMEEWTNKKTPSLLLHTWINLDIKLLSKNEKVFDNFLQEITNYYKNHCQNLFNKYSEEQLKEFTKCIPNYDKIMQYLATKKSPANLESYQILIIIQYAVRLTTIIKQKYAFLELSPIWDSRSLYKQAIMNRFYNSTRFGRRKDFIACISEKHILPQGYSLSADFIEFLEFLDDFFIQYLNNIEDTDLLDKLSEDLSKEKEVKITNTFFNIEIAPKKMETYRLSTGSKKYSILNNIDKPRKNPQISLKLYKVTQKITPTTNKNQNKKQNQSLGDTLNDAITTTNEISNVIISEKKERKVYARRRSINDPTKLVDHQKLKAMIGPNIIHSMDSSIVHFFRSLVNRLNKRFQKDKIFQEDKTEPVFQLALEMNHDCYILSFPVLLPILLEECYLRLSDINYLKKIEGINISKYERMSVEEFEKLLTPINPDFIK